MNHRPSALAAVMLLSIVAPLATGGAQTRLQGSGLERPVEILAVSQPAGDQVNVEMELDAGGWRHHPSAGRRDQNDGDRRRGRAGDTCQPGRATDAGTPIHQAGAEFSGPAPGSSGPASALHSGARPREGPDGRQPAGKVGVGRSKPLWSV